MPLATLFCTDLPKVMPKKKTIRVKKMDSCAKSEVTICFEMKLSKSDIPVQGKAEELWRDDVWKEILALQNLEDKIPIDNEDGFLNKILKEDFKADIKDLKGALASAICVKACSTVLVRGLPVSVVAPIAAPIAAPVNKLV
jgi:hypothetical protein